MIPRLKILGLAVLVAAGIGDLRAAHSDSGFEDCPMLADAELDQLRGGFDAASGSGPPLSFTFGIERATFLNGQLVSTTTVAIPTFPVAQAADISQINPVTVIQNGPGNMFSLPNLQNLPASVMTVIQNSLDNQVIGNVTVINASITSSGFLRSLATQSALNQMVYRAVQ